MKGLKKVLVGLAIFVYIPLCFIVASSFALNRTLTNQTYVQNILRDSGVYEAVAVQLQITFEKDTEGEEVPTQVKTALSHALTKESIQSAIEPVINTAYEVLDDPDAIIEKKINLKPLKDKFSKSLESQLTKRAQSLPTCTASNPPTTNDIFTINCIPPGTNVNQTIQTAVNDTLATDGVLEDTVSVAGLLEENPSGLDIIRQASSLYNWTKLSIYIGIILLGIATTVIITLSSKIRGGVHRVTTLLLTTAILMAGSSWLMLFVLNKVNFVAEQSISIESSLGSAFRLLSLDVFRVVLWFSVVYGVLGVALLIGLYATEKKKQKTAVK